MEKERIAQQLLECFPKSFINRNGEFIAHKKSNTYMRLDNKETWLDVAVGVVEWFSRAAYKTEPYYSDAANAKFHRFMLDGINKFLGPARPLTHEDMELVYTYLGNGVHHSLAVQFVESDCDMDLLREYERSKACRE
jgi:hypothetical protein